MTSNKFKYNDMIFTSLRAMVDKYKIMGTGCMMLVDEADEVIAHIDPNKHLSGVDLSGVDLSGLDLSNAGLRNADLSNADLSDAGLSNANLRNANLRNADLRNANLSNARICSANMYGSDLFGATLGALPSGLKIPRGKLIGYKKIVNGNGEPLIAKILVKGGTPRSKATTNKMRAKSVVVLGFYEVNGERSKHTIGYSEYDTTFCYTIGKINCNNWDSNRWHECAGGIHFFLAWRDAIEYNL